MLVAEAVHGDDDGEREREREKKKVALTLSCCPAMLGVVNKAIPVRRLEW